jgi:outer membrane protein W
MSLFIASALVAGLHMPKAYSAEVAELEESDDALISDTVEMDNIDIDGKLTPSEKLKKKRELLEEKNRALVEKRIESIRLKQEIALTNKIEEALNSDKEVKEDKVQVGQAAPVVAANAASLETSISGEKLDSSSSKSNKIIPFFGVTSIKGTNIDFESKVNAGATIETMILSRLSVGLGVGYTTVDITDVSNNFVNTAYGPLYNSYFSSGRKISFDKTTLEANSKFFISTETLIKPFVGASISYNRSSLKYDDNGNGYNYNGITYGGEGFSTTAIGGSAKLGAELSFNENVGLNLDVSYSKNISSGISTTNNANVSNTDQLRLQNVAKAMEDSDITAIQAGVVVKF